MKSNTRNGATMLELMVMIPTATVLIGAMAMSIANMMRARSQDDSLFRNTYDLANAASQIASDLESATAHVASSATYIEFVVPDRNGDGLPEQMSYEWGGTTGSNANKILWKYNSQAQSVMFEDVGEFSLQKNTSSAPTSSSIANHLLSETAVLKSINALPNGVFREQVINANNSIGQYFIPNGPSIGTKWDLGSIRLMVRAADLNTDGVLCIRVMRSDSSKLPISPILAEVKISEGKLGPSYQWLDIPIAPVSWQSNGTPLCITLSYAGGTGDVARVQYIENGTGMPTNTNLVTSTNGGATWTASTSAKGLRFYAYGFYGSYAGQRSFLNGIDLKMGSSRNATKRIETSARMIGLPEIP